jgi:hypothetical protein
MVINTDCRKNNSNRSCRYNDGYRYAESFAAGVFKMRCGEVENSDASTSFIC